MFHNPNLLLAQRVSPADLPRVLRKMGVSMDQLCECVGAALLHLEAFSEEATNARIKEVYCPSCGVTIMDIREHALNPPLLRACPECGHEWENSGGLVANPLACYKLSLKTRLDGSNVVSLGHYNGNYEAPLSYYFADDSLNALPRIVAHLGSWQYTKRCCIAF